MGCCCLSKPVRRKPQPPLPRPSLELPKENTPLEKQEVIPEQAKIWIEQSEEKIERAESPVKDKVQPQVPSKRRQLLKDLFNSAKAKQSKNRATSPRLKIQKMETMESASQAPEQKARSLQSLEQAIRQLIKNNKQQLTCCSICTENYDQSRPPMMVCMNQHTFCLQCIRDLWRKGYRKCPLDLNTYEIESIQKNRLILSILEQMPAKN